MQRRWEHESIILERPERRGDRARARLSLHTESPRKEYIDGKVRIEVRTSGAARLAMRKYGFEPITPVALAERKRLPPGVRGPAPGPATVPPSHPTPGPADASPPVSEPVAAVQPSAPAPVVDVAVVDVGSMSKSQRKKLASKLKIEGRSKMSDDELVAAIEAELVASGMPGA